MVYQPGDSAFGSWELGLEADTDRWRWSDAVYEILGLARETPATQSAYAGCVHPNDLARVVVALDSVHREGALVELEHRVVRPDRSMRLVQLRAWRSSDARTLLATIEDVTSRAAITDRLSSVSAFAAGVAHEINNPLGFISANLELIELEHTPDDPAAARELGTLVREARHGIQRIHTVVRGLMTFSRIEPTYHEPLDVNRVIEGAIAIANSEIQPRARLVRTFGALPRVDANAARLGQVFLNLLLNAAQSIVIGHPDDHEITVTTRDDSGRVVIDISDTGRGIPREVGQRVFDAFFTTRPAGAGPGLGLSACRNIVHALGGEITFESEPGKTVFRVVLPAHPPAPVVATSALVDPEPSARRGHVLIVDDEVTFANSLKRLLGREHEVTVCHQGNEALDRLRAGERFDAIVSDLRMPGIGGIELHEALMTLAVGQAERMIFLSGGISGAVATEFLEGVTNPCFDKPCDLDELRAAIRRLVG